jgi:hypothetical protein
MRVGFLAHDQPIGTRPRTFLSEEGAKFLEKKMAVERISRKLVRAFPPNSKFAILPAAHRSIKRCKLGSSAEIPGLRFRLERSQAGRYVAEMHHLALKAFQHGMAQEAAAL